MLEGNLPDMKKNAKRLDKKLEIPEIFKKTMPGLDIIFDNMPDGILIGNETGIIKANRKSLEMYGLTSIEELNLKIKNIPQILGMRNFKTGEIISNGDDIYTQALAGKYLTDEFTIIDPETKHEKIIKSTGIPVEFNNKKLAVAVINTDITEIKIAEEKQEKLLTRLVEAQNLMKTLSRSLIQVQELERRNIARELHDEIGQSLTAVKIDMLNIMQQTKSAQIQTQLKDSIQLVEESLNEVRELSLNLRPSILDDLGLLPAIRWYVDRQSQRSGIKGKVITKQIEGNLSPELQIACYRIVQEAITNIIKHAKAETFSIELERKSNDLHLLITDDGIGYNVSIARRKAINGQSIGVLGMQERAELVGGWLDIYSSSKKGTKVYAILPLNTSSQNIDKIKE